MSATDDSLDRGDPHAFSLSSRLPPWATQVRQMVAPLVTALLCFIVVVCPDTNQLFGQYAFLLYTSVILFFFPRGRVSQQIEENTINFVGAVLGLSWSLVALAIAAWCGNHYGADKPQARAVLGIGLACLSFACGVLRSYAPRLNVACRASLFYPIFLLTAEQNITEVHSYMFLEQFFVALLAYAFSTVSGVLFSEHSSSPLLGAQVLTTMDTICQLLPMSLTTIMDIQEDSFPSSPTITPTVSIFPPASPISPLSPVVSVHGRLPPKALEDQIPTPGPRSRQEELARQLRKHVADVRSAHAQYTLDIVNARQHPKALLPVIRLLARIQRNALLGPTGHVPGERIRTALERTHGTPLHSRASSRTASISGTPHRRRSSGHLSANSDSTRQRSSSLDWRAEKHADLSATQLVHKLSQVTSHVNPRQVSGGSRTIAPARSKLTSACTDLSTAIVAAVNATADQLAIACEWPRHVHEGSLTEIKENLAKALGNLQKRLSGIIDTAEVANTIRTHSTATMAVDQSRLSIRGVVFEDEMTSADWLEDEDRFRVAFYMIALLDLAKETSALMDQAISLRENAKPKRWIFPAIIWPWSKVPRDMPLPTVAGEVRQRDEEADDPHDHQDLDFVHALLREKKPPTRRRRARLATLWRSVWDRRGVVTTRVVISHALHSIKHSRHVLFGLKQTIGVMLLALPSFLPAGNAGRDWYDEWRGAWMVVSFMYVIEVTTGATMRIGFYRLIGTFIGALSGFICVLIAHSNPYGLVALGTFFAVPITYGILFTHVAPMAIVTGITLSPILFIQYLGIDKGQSEWTIAWHRFVDIAIGIAAAVFIGSWLWPIHARVQYFRAVADTMDQITEYYLRMSRDLLRPSLVYQANNRQYVTLEAAVRRQIVRCRTLVDIQKRELSLLPRPVKLYSEAVDLMERLSETLSEVRTLRFSLPRKATVLDVLPTRRELVSALLVNIWAVGQAFRSRSPLPQLLPSPRVPLGEVMEATDDHAREVRTMRARQNHRRGRATIPTANGAPPSPSPAGIFPASALHQGPSSIFGANPAADGERDPISEGTDRAELAVLYGMAENEALGEAINCIEELLAAARTLFGTQSFDLTPGWSQPGL